VTGEDARMAADAAIGAAIGSTLLRFMVLGLMERIVKPAAKATISGIYRWADDRLGGRLPDWFR
jgi:hypothetical protein